MCSTMLRQFSEFDCPPLASSAALADADVAMPRRPSLHYEQTRARGVAERAAERQHARASAARSHAAYDANHFAAAADNGIRVMAAHPAVVVHIGHRSSHLGPEKEPSADVFREPVPDQKSALHPLFNEPSNFDALVFDAVEGGAIFAAGCHA
jgi:hypothetical protein